MGWRARLAVLGFCTGTAVLIVVGVQIYGKTDSDITSKYLLWVFFALYATHLFINLAGTAVNEVISDRDEKAVLERIDTNEKSILEKLSDIPSLIARHSDLIVFPDQNAGLEHCIANCRYQKFSVRNTVLRYEDVASADPNDTVYRRWLDSRKTAIGSLKNNWKEIVSSNFEDSDPHIMFSKEMSKLGTRYYDLQRVDDKAHPMVQLILFEFDDKDAEVIFGWDFPGNRRGPSVLSTNPAVVRYFKGYFDYWFAELKKQSS
jgi:hypothetical protein